MTSNLQFEIKRFNELSTLELYQLLALRSEVFVVEQNCVYQDIDGKDLKAVHVLGKVEGEILVYSRLFLAGDYFENASIGRVVIHPKVHAQKFGHDLMRKSIQVIEEISGSQTIEISAQSYLLDFYQQHGFTEIEPSYLEDGIPHHRMFRD